MDNRNDAPGWNRHELNLRLTKRRIAQLRAIAARLPGSPTPTDAIDAALAQAAAPDGFLAARLDEFEAAFAARAEESRSESARLEKLAKASERSLADLHALIAEAVANPDGT